jgi:two-component system, NtrC family, sensor histidine kinase KinB
MPIDESENYRWLYRISHALHEQAGSTRAILQTALSLTAQAVTVERGCIVTLDGGTIQDAYLLGGEIDGETERDLWNRLIGQGLIGFVQHAQRTIVIRDLKTDPRWPRLKTGMLTKSGSAIGLPLVANDIVGGVMILLNPKVDYFDTAMIGLLETIVGTVAAAVAQSRRYEQAARSEAHYRQLHEDALVGVIITDLPGQVIDANPKACALLGFDRATLLGLSVTTLFRLNADSGTADRLRSIETGQELDFSTTARTSRGDTIAVRLRARRAHLDDREVTLWVSEDVTTEVTSEQYRRDLTAMTYHDMRGPLHNISGSLSRLDKLIQGEQNPAVYELMNVATRSTRQLTRMVKSLLDIERLEAGKADLNRETVVLSALLSNVAEMVYTVTEEAEQHLDFEVADDLPSLLVDADMILRVITNLVENAAKYTPTGGRIVVSAKRMEGGVCISVSDSGPGVPRQVQEHIFEKYVRLNNSNGPSGVGLGLAFCRLAVEAHGGRIWVSSEPDSPGAVFSFLLPASPQATPATV